MTIDYVDNNGDSVTSADAPPREMEQHLDDHESKRSAVIMRETANKQRGIIIPALGAPVLEWPTNLPLHTPRGKALMMECGNPATIKLDKSGVARVRANYWLIRRDSRINEDTGEVVEFTRVSLINSDGEHFSTTSAMCASRLSAALEMYDESDWKRGIPFVITRKMGDSGRMYHHISVECE